MENVLETCPGSGIVTEPFVKYLTKGVARGRGNRFGSVFTATAVWPVACAPGSDRPDFAVETDLPVTLPEFDLRGRLVT